MNSKRVSIIIVNYNNGDVLLPCLQSVKRWTDPATTEVILVDNASTDGSPAKLAQAFPDYRWLMAGENVGFGRANNLGAKAATGDYLFFLNPDTELLSPTLEPLLAAFENKALQVGAAGLNLINEFGEADTAAGNFPGRLDLLKELFPARFFPYRLRTKKITNDLLAVDYISGADLMMPRVVFEKLGGFDPDFFLYYEETELQFRLQKAGYLAILNTAATIKHLCGTPDHKVNARKIAVFERSRVIFHRKCYGISGGLWARLWLLLFYGSRWLAGGPNHYLTGIKIAFQR